MQNYEQILAELEIEIPEDKKEPLRKAWNQNYKTIADYNKQVEKTKRYQSEIEERPARGSIHEKLQIYKEKSQRESETGKETRKRDFGLE